jgi:signal transduction histidine kinase
VRLFTEIQEKSRQLEIASQHKSQFLANMSHELRTPLNAILGYTEMMADGLYGDIGAKAQGVLERVQSNGKHLLGLINDVLDLSKIEAGQLMLAHEPYSVADMVNTVVAATESLARAKGIGLTTAVASGLPAGTGDARRLSQVLLNLVGNAIKFTDQGSVAIRAAQAGGAFELSVVDTGLGIRPEDQGRIFDEFQQVDDTSTRKKGGTGLGLSISRKIVELHGGRIAVHSTVGQGSTFTVTIPIDAPGAKDAA